MTKPYPWENPVRTGSDAEPPPLDGRTCVPDPAAVERLKQLIAAQRQDDAAPVGRRARLARLHRRLEERNRRRAAVRVWVDDVER